MQRRDFLKVTGITVASTAALSSLSNAAPDAANTQPSPPVAQAGIRTGPYLQDPATDAMTVMWMTTVPGYGFVEYGPTQQLGQKMDATVDGLIQSNTVLHKVRLTGLKPGARCFYRVCFQATPTFRSHKIEFGPTISSAVHSFVTRDPAAKSVRFMMYNDIHDQVDLWRTLHGRMEKEAVDFAFLNGDITNEMQDEKQMVEHFLDMCTGMFATETPFLYTRGNHEVRGGYSREMKKYLGLPGGEYYYAFSQGPARFVVLDSGEDKEDSHADYFGMCAFDGYRTMQQEFLRKEMQSEAWKSARWRIALFHIPGYYSNGWHGPTEVKEKWHPLLNEGKADLFLAGHTHKYTVAAANPAKGHNYPIIIGGGPKPGKATVTLVEADEKNIRVKMTRDDGEVVGELVV